MSICVAAYFPAHLADPPSFAHLDGNISEEASTTSLALIPTIVSPRTGWSRCSTLSAPHLVSERPIRASLSSEERLASTKTESSVPEG